MREFSWGILNLNPSPLGGEREVRVAPSFQIPRYWQATLEYTFHLFSNRDRNILWSVSGENPSVSLEASTVGMPTVLPLTEIGKKTGGQWTLTLYPAHLALADAPGAQPYVLREQLMKSVVLMEGTRALVVQQPRKVMFKLTPDGVTWVKHFIRFRETKLEPQTK